MTWVSSCTPHQFEFRPKADILVELVNDLLLSKKTFKDHVFIHFSNYFVFDRKTHTEINYGEDSYVLTSNNSKNERLGKGVILNIHDYDFSINKNLTMINNFIDSLLKNKPDSDVVNKILKRKIYRNKAKIDELNKLDYYFEGGRFQFYYLTTPNDTSSIRTINLFQTQNVLEMYGDRMSEGVFVFTNDSVFQFARHDSVSNQIKFNWRLPNDTLLYERSPIKRTEVDYYERKSGSFLQKFILHYNFDNKAVFIPSETFVETNYKEKEIEFIYSFINKPVNTIPPETKKDNKFIFIILLIISLTLNIYLFIKSRRR